MLPFLAQLNGYYSGRLISNEYARTELVNLEYLIRETNKKLFHNLGVGTINDMILKINQGTGKVKNGYKFYIKKTIKTILPKSLYSYGKRVYLKYVKR